MKKMLILTAAFSIIFALGLSCVEPPGDGDFNVQWGADTSTVKTVSTAGEAAGFKYLIKNNTEQEMVLKIDAPNSATELPENWDFQICVDISCMAPGVPAYAHAKEGTLSDTITFDIITAYGSTATEGTVTMMISDSSGVSSEVDTVVLTAKIQQ